MGYLLIAFLYLIGYAISAACLIHDITIPSSPMLGSRYVSKGDLAFCLVIAIYLPVGWIIGLKNLIGAKIDWDSPAFKKDQGRYQKRRHPKR